MLMAAAEMFLDIIIASYVLGGLVSKLAKLTGPQDLQNLLLAAEGQEMFRCKASWSQEPIATLSIFALATSNLCTIFPKFCKSVGQ